MRHLSAKPALTAASVLALALGAAGGSASLTACGTSDKAQVGLSVSALVFESRAHTVLDPAGNVKSITVAGGNGQVVDYTRYVPGAKLRILSPPRPDGTVRNIIEAFTEADLNGFDISFDAKSIVFSMKRDAQDKYHLYFASLSPGPDGKFALRPLTGGDRNDITPVFAPGGRIVFATDEMYTVMGTRADEYNHSRSATQLASITVDGGDADRRLASQNLSHTVAPFLRHNGKVGYSRWEHLGAVNDVKLFETSPADFTQMTAIAGQHGKPSNSLVNVRELEPNVFIGIATSRNRTIHAGALVKIDARNRQDPVCLDAKITDKTGHACLDEENVTYEILTPEVPTGNGPSPVGRYRTPSALPDGRLLVSWATGAVNDLSEQSLSPPNFGVYLFDPAKKVNQLIFDDPNMWDLNAMAVAPRVEPPVIGELVARNVDPSTPVRIGSVDVTQTSLLTETVSGGSLFGKGVPFPEALKSAVKVRIIEGFSSEGAKGVSMFGLTMDEGAAILGEADVNADGSWLAEIPPYTPVHLQPIDKFGMSIRNQRLWIQGMPGEDRRCVGCHEARAVSATRARSPNPTVAEQRQAQQFLMPVAERSEISWSVDLTKYPEAKPKALVQDILTKKCASCHGGASAAGQSQGQQDPFAGKTYAISRTTPGTGATTTYTIPWLDLSDKPVTVVYDRKVATYPASYVSLFFPATLDMGMGMGTAAQGELPPKWAIVNDARSSVMIKKLNVKAADGSFAYEGGAMHPEDKGVTLTDEERLTLIRAIDIGGQFYTRQNTGFVPNTVGAAGQKYP
jgi:hypothetical protein